MAGGIVHWDDVQPVRRDEGHLSAAWRYLGRAAGSDKVTVNRIEIDPNRWSTPSHVEGEEIVFVLAGSGQSWQDGTVYEVRQGDCIVYGAGREAHALRAGDDGLDVLVYGRDGYEREQETAGEPEVGEPAERPPNIVNVEALEPDDEGDRDLADTAGSTEAGLHHRTMVPGTPLTPAHCHSAEEEIFVMLEGTARLELIPSPVPASRGVKAETHELGPGHVVCRPPGTKVSHFFRPGDDGATMLVYGTREPNDIAYYPRSNKFYIRGIGLIGRLEALDYWDGEPEPPG